MSPYFFMSNLKPLMPKLIFYQVSWQTSAFHWSSWVPCKTWILLENLQSMWTWKKLHFYLYWTSTRPHVRYVHFPIKYYYINILPEFIWFLLLAQQSSTPNVLNKDIREIIVIKYLHIISFGGMAWCPHIASLRKDTENKIDWIMRSKQLQSNSCCN